jgi:hypothetical protein
LRPHEHAALLRLIHERFVKKQNLHAAAAGSQRRFRVKNFAIHYTEQGAARFSGKVVLPLPSGGYYYRAHAVSNIFLHKFYNRAQIVFDSEQVHSG